MATRHRMVLPLRETVTPDLTYLKRQVSNGKIRMTKCLRAAGI